MACHHCKKWKEDCDRYRKYLKSIRDRLFACRCQNLRHRKLPHEIDDYLYLMREGRERDY